ncbi:hypothetical protein AB3X91_11820 [Paraburkholderia sp. BR14263]
MEIDEIDAVLIDWYEWSEGYAPALGYGRADATCRGFKISRQWMEYDDLSSAVDGQLRASTGKAVEPIVLGLALHHRIAVTTAVRNFIAGGVVFRNPRSPETQDADYADAKRAMMPALVVKGLIRGKDRKQL